MNTSEILFQYLKDILYHTEEASLDIGQLPPEFRKLGLGMEQLGQWLKEARRVSMSMAKGELECGELDKENVVAAPLKELQGTLRHLAWQTQQVAKGDYSQTVDFMGEFSEGFNTMTRQLQERRDALLEEKQKLEQSFQLAAAFADHTNSMIFIYAADGQGELFRNRSAEYFLEMNTDVGRAVQEQLGRKDGSGIEATHMWGFEISGESNEKERRYFLVESYAILWKQQRALVHIVMDDTERKTKENRMQQLAYEDSLTGLYNQRYAMERMREWIRLGTPFTLAFIDVDYLKYCNDTLGHEAGDVYLRTVARTIESLGGMVCRTGGDEFLLLQTEKSSEEQNRALEQQRENLQAEGERRGQPWSFSYASCEVPANPEKSLEEYVAQADAMMYQYKVKYRKPLKDVLYRDERKLKE